MMFRTTSPTDIIQQNENEFRTPFAPITAPSRFGPSEGSAFAPLCPLDFMVSPSNFAVSPSDLPFRPPSVTSGRSTPDFPIHLLDMVDETTEVDENKAPVYPVMPSIHETHTDFTDTRVTVKTLVRIGDINQDLNHFIAENEFYLNQRYLGNMVSTSCFIFEGKRVWVATYITNQKIVDLTGL